MNKYIINYIEGYKDIYNIFDKGIEKTISICESHLLSMIEILIDSDYKIISINIA